MSKIISVLSKVDEWAKPRRKLIVTLTVASMAAFGVITSPDVVGIVVDIAIAALSLL